MNESKVAQEVLRIESKPVTQDPCPECGFPLDRLGACEFCRHCGYGPCG